MSGREQVNIMLFNKWDMSQIEVNDQGLRTAISLKPAVIPVTFGRHEHQRLKKAEVNIVERLANKMMHFGKKYAKNTGRMGGKSAEFNALTPSPQRISAIVLRRTQSPCRRSANHMLAFICASPEKSIRAEGFWGAAALARWRPTQERPYA